MSNILSAAVGILIFILLGIFAGGAFVLNIKNKKERTAAVKKEEAEQRYQEEKHEIFQEVFGDAEKEKSQLSGNSDIRARFDAINNSLRNNEGDRKSGGT